MRGTVSGSGSGLGGPLLCIGDLLTDVGDAADADTPDHIQIQTPSALHFQHSRLTHFFQEHYHELTEALSSTATDHSWTSLTLKLCTAVDTAYKLIESTNSNVMLLSEKIAQLDNIINKGDSAIADLRSIHASIIAQPQAQAQAQPQAQPQPYPSSA